MTGRLLLLFFLLIHLPSTYAADGAGYSTFVQVTSSTKPNHLLVVLLVGKKGHIVIPTTGMVADPSGSVEKGDGAFFSFLLKPGESRSSKQTHPYQKGKTYSSVVSLEPEGAGLWIKYEATVEDARSRLFDSEGKILAGKKALFTP
jgi:hypothetical protein